MTSWATEHSQAGTVFQAQRFGDFPTMKEALIARKIDATFMIAPLAMKLVADGVPVKIVYLGHRDGSALTIAKDSSVQRFEDLAGKRVAIPSRYSNQNLLMRRMMKQRGMEPQAIELVEMAPPDMASALAARSIEGYIVGEPHNAKAEIGGYGRILYFMKDLWPDFISCVLVVRQEIIEERRPLVQELVQGIADSGAWLDDPEDSLDHRKRAAEVVGKLFYNQDPKLLEHVLLQPNRVAYSRLVPPKDTFDEIMDLAVETKVIERRMRFEEYCDTSFASSLREITVNGKCIHSHVLQVLCHAITHALRIAEHNCFPSCICDSRNHFVFIHLVDCQEQVVHRSNSVCWRIDRYFFWRLHVSTHKVAYLAIECC